MKPNVILLGLLAQLWLAFNASSQATYSFEDSILTNWQQSTPDHWHITSSNAIAGKYSLHHTFDNTIAGHDQISLMFDAPLNFNDTIRWAFKIWHSYNPSSSNNWAVYLAADSDASCMYPEATHTAYILGVNYNTNDDLLKLWKVTNGNLVTAFQSTFNWEQLFADTAVLIDIQRNPDGTWLIFANALTNMPVKQYIGSFKAPGMSNGRYFGVYYKYSQTQDQKLWIDDVVIHAQYQNDTTDEPTYSPKANDIIFTEIMFDPEPSVGLPEREYIEVYNKTGFRIPLSGWQIQAGNNAYYLPDSVLNPHAFAILCSEKGYHDMATFGKTIPCFGTENFLVNGENSIRLLDENTHVIAVTAYNSKWIDDAYKANGGWSVELVDTNCNCASGIAWQPSECRLGGTPGLANSTHSKQTYEMPRLLYTAFLSDTMVALTFSQMPDLASLSDIQITFSNTKRTARLLQTDVQHLNSINVVFTPKLAENESDELNIRKLLFCSGLALQNIQARFLIPQQPAYNDLVINEVLFNAFSYGSEFVELYNRSTHTFDLSNLVLAIKDTITGHIAAFCSFPNKGQLLYPLSFIVLTKDVSLIRKFYYVKEPDNICEQSDFMSLPDDAACLVLMNKSMQVVDQFSYTRNMHVAMLSSTDGVALERRNPDGATQLVSNWQSAAQTAGYATPGYQNSQLYQSAPHATANVSPQTFSPNNDGTDDVVNISPGNIENASTTTINIYNSNGHIVRNLLASQYIATDAAVTWDGTADNHQMLPNGIYVVHIVSVNTRGNVHEQKLICVLAR